MVYKSKMGKKWQKDAVKLLAQVDPTLKKREKSALKKCVNFTARLALYVH